MGFLRVTDNDLILYRYLFEQDFLTRDQIKNFVWKDLSNGHINNRLARLTREGYIKKHPDLSAGMGSVLMAGSGAVGLLNNDDIIERMMNLKSSFINKEKFIRAYSEREKLNFARYNHDEYLTDVRFKLEILAKEYMSYRMLMVYNRNVKGKNKKEKLKKKFTRPTPDALMKDSDDIIAIELENTLKQDFRYQDKIFRGYVINQNVDMVLYICTNKSVFKGVEDNINKFFKKGYIEEKGKSFKISDTRFLVADYEQVMKGESFTATNYKTEYGERKLIDKCKFNFN